MFLSQVQLNDRSRAAQRDITSPYQMHASLCRVFANPDQTPPRFLWRIDHEPHHAPTLLLQSEVEPNWSALLQHPAFGDYCTALPQTKRLPLEQLKAGQILGFRLRANPTISKKVSKGERGKRQGLILPEEQLQWLERQGQRGGFKVLEAVIVKSQRLVTQKHFGGAPITLQAVLFEGYLRIESLEAFQQTLCQGIGHGKGLGLGLLSVASATKVG